MAENKKIVRVEETRTLKVELTREEIFDAGQKAADAQQLIVELDAEEKAFKDAHKGKKSGAEADLSRNSNLVRNKYDYRRIRCVVENDYTKFRVVVTRLDTGEKVEDREMNADEKSRLPV